jgi:glyoxylase-like metal-dependent hydrolase (beta-lactamase superfamily II)
MDATGAPAYINELDIGAGGRGIQHKIGPDKKINWYKEGDTVMAGNLEFTILETPGHTPGSVTLKCETALFTGDTLFRDSCGRTDLGGSIEALMSSLHRLSALEGDFEVYPGHEESTTLSRERSFNFYMKSANGEM